MSVTTTDGLRGRRLFRCDICRHEAEIVVPKESRLVCLDCLPPKEQLIFREPEEVVEWVDDLGGEG